MERETKKELKWIDWAIVLLIILFVIISWEIFVKLKNIPVYILPAPSAIFMVLFNNYELYFYATALTFFEAIIGLFVGVVAGIITASIIGIFPRLERGVMLLALMIKSIPLVAIAPMLTIWFGFGVLPKIVITALLSFFPVLINMFSGLKAVQKEQLDVFLSWNAKKTEIFFKLQIPGAMPYLFASLRVSAPLSLMGAIIAEWTGANKGLGRTMWLAYANLNLPYLFAAVLILAGMGILIYTFIIWLESKVIFWNK